MAHAAVKLSTNLLDEFIFPFTVLLLYQQITILQPDRDLRSRELILNSLTWMLLCRETAREVVC
jgi:hypothetical protein